MLPNPKITHMPSNSEPTNSTNTFQVETQNVTQMPFNLNPNKKHKGLPTWSPTDDTNAFQLAAQNMRQIRSSLKPKQVAQTWTNKTRTHAHTCFPTGAPTGASNLESQKEHKCLPTRSPQITQMPSNLKRKDNTHAHQLAIQTLSPKIRDLDPDIKGLRIARGDPALEKKLALNVLW